MRSHLLHLTVRDMYKKEFPDLIDSYGCEDKGLLYIIESEEEYRRNEVYLKEFNAKYN